MNKEDTHKHKHTDTAEETVTDNEQDTDVSFEEVNEEGEVDIRATVKKLRERIKKLEGEKKEYVDLSQRLRADYVNFKKEVEQSRNDDRKFAAKRIILDLLPVLDAYDMARANKEAWEKVDATWRMGIEYIFGQVLTLLEREGVTAFGEVGDHFDPYRYESIEHVPITEEQDDNTVVQVLQKGYTMGDMILRPARVKTGEFKK